ncbi:transcription elongation factor GreA [Paraburkholderia sp. RL17-373-BIF-A]|uniref:transcription elongation factor GreA n=1 Tax=Paraburkholderia sp. RL17-373-BIF-A TaxID=3031629 RepID=UPI0038B93C81
MNLPRSIGAVVSRRLATLHELQTVYGAEDLYNLLEVIAVDSHNERELNKPRK